MTRPPRPYAAGGTPDRPNEPGRWVWVPDTKRITLRDKAKAQAYDRRWQKDNRKTKPNSATVKPNSVTE